MVMVWNSITSSTPSACCSSALVIKSGWYTSPLGNGDSSGIGPPVRTLGNTLQSTKSITIAGAQHQDQTRSTQPGARLSRGSLPALAGHVAHRGEGPWRREEEVHGDESMRLPVMLVLVGLVSAPVGAAAWPTRSQPSSSTTS